MWTRLLVAMLLLLAATTPALAQEPRAGGQIRSSGPVTSEASRKIASTLRTLIDDVMAKGFTTESARPRGAEQRPSEGLKVDGDGRVQVYVSVADTSETALGVLRLHDVEIELVNDDFRIVQGWIPVERLEALAAEDVVLKIRPPSYGDKNAGSVTSEGTKVHHCDAVHAQGITGAGVTVGVISGGVDGLASAQASGNLPAVQVVVPQNGPDDEGTAMLEIVHDCAPGASLLFASYRGTSMGFIQAVNALQASGANIIVDDISFAVTGARYFEDDEPAINDSVVGTQVVRISSAGNFGERHYQGDFVPGPVTPLGIRHVFGAGNTLLPFKVEAGQTVAIVLQWDNRFGAASDDYHFCVRYTNGDIFGCSQEQNGADDPVESKVISCQSVTDCFFYLEILLYAGSPRTLEVFCFRACTLLEFGFPFDAIVGHAARPEVLAVAAVSAANPSVIDLWSSGGPSTIRFPSTDIRFKPDLTGVDCVATSRPSGGLNPFCGTSAAAPHVAGVAALVMQAMGPSATPAGVRQVLKDTADDLGSAGFDLDFGSGRVNALAAVQAVPPPPPPPPPPSSTFVDVPPSHVFSVFVGALAKAGITGGCATNPPRYCPDVTVKRDQMAVFLLRGTHGAGYQPPPTTGTMFTDAPPNQQFASWIEQLAREGITGGCGTNPPRYCPDLAVTRGQMAVFLLRAKHGSGYVPPKPAEQTFSDVPLTHTFASWIYELAAEGITGGCGPAGYCPDASVTRGQMAVFLVRTFNLPM